MIDKESDTMNFLSFNSTGTHILTGRKMGYEIFNLNSDLKDGPAYISLLLYTGGLYCFNHKIFLAKELSVFCMDLYLGDEENILVIVNEREIKAGEKNKKSVRMYIFNAKSHEIISVNDINVPLKDIVFVKVNEDRFVVGSGSFVYIYDVKTLQILWRFNIAGSLLNMKTVGLTGFSNVWSVKFLINVFLEPI
jgi:hypothetical protein